MYQSIALATIFSLLSGCFVAQHSRSMRLKHAATLPHPSKSRGVSANAPVTAVAPDRTTFRMVRFDRKKACVQVAQKLKPETILDVPYELSVWEDPAQRLKLVPKSAATTGTLVNSSSKQVPYQKIVVDKHKDDSGNVIATTERQVQAWRTEYDSTMEVCFEPPEMTEASSFVMLRPVVPPVRMVSMATEVWFAPTMMFRLGE